MKGSLLKLKNKDKVVHSNQNLNSPQEISVQAKRILPRSWRGIIQTKTAVK